MNTKQRKTLIIRTLLFGGTVISLFFVPWAIVMAWIKPLPDTIEAQLQQTLDYGFDGVIVYVDQAGKPPGFYAAGWHDRDNEIAAYPDAYFKIASISKLYTAVALTKLAKEDKLSFDDKLSEYYPELVGRIENAEQITLKMMVQHRSGIPNYTDNPEYWLDEQGNGQNALDFALDLPASFAPDQGYEYSNTNYLLLRSLMDDVLGYDHSEYIKAQILQPLQLNNTFFSITEVGLDDVMSGYYVGYEEDFKEREYGMMATAEDVGTFLRALNDGSVFNSGEQELYPYVYDHGGLVVGYQSLAEYHKDIDAVVVQFINTTDFEGYEWNLSEVAYNRVVKILRKSE